MACLDTSVLLDLAGRGGRIRAQQAGARARELAVSGESLVTTRFNAAELYVGIERARRREDEAAKVHLLLSGLQILDFDDTSARLFATLTAYLQRIGQPAGDMDVLIASVALAYGHSIVTANWKHFDRLPGLAVVRWT